MVPRAHLVRAVGLRRRRDAARRVADAVSLAPVTRLALLGGGRMGEALVAGLLDAGWEGDALAVAEVDSDRRRALESRFPAVRVVPSPAWAAAETDVLVVAVKPNDVGPALESCAASLPAGALVLSIAAGVTLASLEAAVPDHAVVRAMPNTPALVRQGAAAIAAGPPRHRRAPRARRARARRGRHRRARSREAARRGHRAVGLGSGVRVPRRRDADRGGRARRAAPRRRGRARAPDAAGSAALLGDGSETARSTARRGHLAWGYHRGRSADARGARRARRVPGAVEAATDRSRELGRAGD